MPVLPESRESFTDEEMQELLEFEGTWVNLPDYPAPFRINLGKLSIPVSGTVGPPGTYRLCHVAPHTAWFFVHEYRRDAAGRDYTEFQAIAVFKEEGRATTEIRFRKRFAEVYQGLNLGEAGTGIKCDKFFAREPGTTEWGFGEASRSGVTFKYDPSRVVHYGDIASMRSAAESNSGSDGPQIFLFHGYSETLSYEAWRPVFADYPPEAKDYPKFFFDVCHKRLQKEQSADCLNLTKNALAHLAARMGVSYNEKSQSQINGDAYDKIQAPEWRDACRKNKIPFPECEAAESALMYLLHIGLAKGTN
jgi:hypothetical protein